MTFLKGKKAQSNIQLTKFISKTKTRLRRHLKKFTTLLETADYQLS